MSAWGTVYQLERDKALGIDAESLRRNQVPQPMDTAPRDGTHVLAYLYTAPDDCGYRGFGEWREIWWNPYRSLGMEMPWHAGDPWDSHSQAEPPEHFGDGVPVAWLPLPPRPR